MSSFTHNADHDHRVSGARLHLYLGYAAGVGKTYRMLEDAQQLARQGKDIVVGYFEPHGRKDTIAQTVGLEMAPLRSCMVGDATFYDMDVDAIIRRKPEICVVDELAHSNIPGSARKKRWEDILVLLDAGVTVMRNMNIQHLESLNDQIYRITGVRVRETVPDWFIKSATEIVMVDATTGALINRLKRGVIYSPEKAQRALENFFKESTLAALREIALRQTAHELESRDAGELQGPPHETSNAPVTKRDRILILLTAAPETAALIRRGRRMADYLGADCFAVCVTKLQKDTLANKEQQELEKHLNFARNLHIETRVLEGDKVAELILDFAHHNQITQILAARPKGSLWSSLRFANPILQLVRLATDIRIIVVADRRKML
jgi:two-component system, OmpR family, sensor histidine kinase KdpD